MITLAGATSVAAWNCIVGIDNSGGGDVSTALRVRFANVSLSSPMSNSSLSAPGSEASSLVAPKTRNEEIY